MSNDYFTVRRSRHGAILAMFIVGVIGIIGSNGTRYAYRATPATQTAENKLFVATLSPVCPSGCNAFLLTIKNKTDKDLEVDWNRTLYIANGATSGGFMFEGVVFKDRNDPKPPDIVFGNSSFSKTIWPNNLVHFETGKYGGWRQDDMPSGENGAYLTVKAGDKEIKEKMTTQITAVATR